MSVNNKARRRWGIVCLVHARIIGKSQQSVKYPPQPGQGQEAYLAETRSRIGSSIKRAEQAMMAVKSKVLREYDLSVAQYAAMTSLYYVPGQSAAQLARAAAVTPQTMATILARLDTKSLITRVPSEVHSRVNIVTLTDAGEELVVQADEKVRAVERAMSAEFTSQEREQLQDLLDRLIGFLEHKGA